MFSAQQYIQYTSRNSGVIQSCPMTGPIIVQEYVVELFLYVPGGMNM